MMSQLRVQGSWVASRDSLMTIQKEVNEIQMHEKGHGHHISNTNNNRQSINMC